MRFRGSVAQYEKKIIQYWFLTAQSIPSAQKIQNRELQEVYFSKRFSSLVYVTLGLIFSSALSGWNHDFKFNLELMCTRGFFRGQIVLFANSEVSLALFEKHCRVTMFPQRFLLVCFGSYSFTSSWFYLRTWTDGNIGSYFHPPEF